MNTTWRRIPGFNGYEMNEEGWVRSMKNMHANPGHYIKRYNDSKGGYYMISDNNNHKRKMYIFILQTLIDNDTHYNIRGENEINLGARNKIFTDKVKQKQSVRYVGLDMSSLVDQDND